MSTAVDSEPGARQGPARSGLVAVARAPWWVRYALLAAGLVVALWLPNGLYPAVAVDILCWALFAVSVDLLLGFTGLMSFGHAAFWGTSAYVAGIVAIEAGLPFPLAVLTGALAAAVIAVPIGYLAVKRTGIYFAMVTLAFAQMIYYVANKWGTVTGGENGLQAVPRELGGMDLTDEYYFYYAALPITVLGLWAAWRIVNSPFGRVLVGIRDNPARARALGYPVHRYKLTAFVLSAFLAGLGGGLYVMGHQFVSLDALHWTTSGKAVVVVVLGGIGTLWGGVVGAGLLVRLEDWLSFSGFEQIGLVTGAIFVLAVVLFRKGIWGSAAAVAARWSAGRGK
ncbi:branched-chain amino acid ABC transporter permease [Micromonospora mirobrigensis]|uniref:Branched-chain amino acid transport system permease protein n=1 Tax=Micromonospora mirobrigensis TaxID=262898 RepID=A0A1C4ZEH1_9ACTN|nr:branched-chain amino acid ABC transporter permease [Micromonospora mirobrigensis]SCF31339.1 branched-chain amino acid transport system permease protein [Micromonospora mirobrigensis]